MPFQIGATEHDHGVVAERLDVGSYCYFRVVQPQGSSLWVATLRSPIAVGADVDVTIFARRETFDSPRLSRRFTHLAFGRVAPAKN